MPFWLAKTGFFLLMISWKFCFFTRVRCLFVVLQKIFLSNHSSKIRCGAHLRLKTNKAENPWKQRLSALLAGVAKGTWTPDPTLRSKALGTLLLVYRCLMKFLKSLDLRGFLAIVGTWLSVLIWSQISPVSACFVCKMLAWANLVLSTELPNSKKWVLITTPIDLSATDSVLSRNW